LVRILRTGGPELPPEGPLTYIFQFSRRHPSRGAQPGRPCPPDSPPWARLPSQAQVGSPRAQAVASTTKV